MELICKESKTKGFIVNKKYKILKESSFFGEGKHFIVKNEYGVFTTVVLINNLCKFEIVEENKMNKEKLQQIASTMTKEEFKSKYIIKDYSGEEILDIDGEKFVCPNRIGLKNVKKPNGYCCKDCKECWENAIKELKFKEDNTKELNIIEASKMKVGTEFKLKYANYFLHTNVYLNEFKDICWVGTNGELSSTMNEFINAKFIPIVEQEVNFMEAIKAFSEGKKIKSVWGNDEFIYEGELTDSEDKAIEACEILKAKWYIIND